MKAMDPGQILRDTVRRLEPLSSRKNQTVGLAIDAPPGSELQADPSLLNMIFTNLLENAVKHTGDGGKIEVGVRPDGGGSRDTGGSGLGLAVVKHCVTLHSGKVWAESQEGKGSAFYVWLPGGDLKLPKFT